MFCLQRLDEVGWERILKTMSIFVETTPAPSARTKNTIIIATVYALILVVMAVGQLYGFEKFIPLIESFGLPGGHGTATLVAGMIVITEVFAVPFLLRMRLSPLMRAASMVFGWLAAALWFKLAIWANVMTSQPEAIGFLGTSVDLPVGWWAMFYAAALLVLAAWASWGMWPFRRR